MGNVVSVDYPNASLKQRFDDPELHGRLFLAHCLLHWTETSFGTIIYFVDGRSADPTFFDGVRNAVS